MTDDELQAIRERLEAATRAEDWGHEDCEVCNSARYFEEHAPEDIAALLAEVERLRGEKDEMGVEYNRLKQQFSEYRSAYGKPHLVGHLGATR